MIKNYLKIAFRNLLKYKVYGALNVAGLAVSIACGIIVFSMVKYHLSFDNFHHNANRIYRIVTEQHRDKINYSSSVPPALGLAVRNDYSYAEAIARTVSAQDMLVTVQTTKGLTKSNERDFIYAEPSFLQIFNLPLVSGNKKDVLAEPNTAVITETAARRLFGTTDVVGKVMRLDNVIPVRVTGVLKDLPVNTDLRAQVVASWQTIRTYNEWYLHNDSWGGISSDLQCYALLRPDVSIAAMEKDMDAYVPKFRAGNKNVHHYKLQPLSDMHFDSRYGGAMEKKNLWVLSLIGTFLLIAACINFINLATAQALGRSREVGIRKALGSQRFQLFWQFIAETGLITVAATLTAVFIAMSAMPKVNDLFHAQIQLNLLKDPALPGFLLLMMVMVTFMAGAYPGLILSGFKPVAALKGKLSMQQIGGFNTRRSLIVLQFSISLVLIIAMLVISRQMSYTRQFDLGFDKEAVVMVPRASENPDISMYSLRDQLAAIPGVQQVSLCYAAPSSETAWNNSIRFDNRSEDEDFRVSIKSIDEHYFAAFGLKVIAGKNLFKADSAREMIINETMLRKLGLTSPEQAIGKSMVFAGESASAPIVGVVADFHDRSLHEDIGAVAFTTLPNMYQDYAVKVNASQLSTIMPAIEKTWSTMYPEKVYTYKFLDDYIGYFYQTETDMLQIIRIFSFIAIFIACLGLYGLVTFMVAQKRKEIGIRKVLGSNVSGILWLFGKEFGRLILLAFAFAAPLSWWLMSNWLKDFRFHTELSVMTFVSAIFLTLLIAAVTVSLQSAKAAMMNPIRSLRSE
ncbi:ABC transporter permease [Chitinophaga sp. Cy-1792]|uniref:ABC transporter permease n=1 Tax=Chitinophaga sp. Cy-1792 TaxID=2608339 RepID=UPI0014244631|nr:ABC transporter permease [Chitinophaga sp. Cy-1792]